MIGSFRDQDVGGAVVKRAFGGHLASDVLTREQVLAMPGANRAALINLGKIAVFPRPNAGLDMQVSVSSNLDAAGVKAFAEANAALLANALAARADGGAKRHVVSRGFGKYDVIEGVVLNAEPLTNKAAAKALAGEAPDTEH